VAAVLVLVASLGLSACSGGGDDSIHATATFDDVADLAVGAPVMMDDLKVGSVSSIRLDRTGRRATVRFAVERSADVPADVVARVRRTSPLGEKFIDLHPRTTDPKAPALADGTVIHRTEVVSDLEQMIGSGTATFTALSASQLAVLLDEGQRAFGGKGPALNQILSRLSTVAHGYAGRTDQIGSIIDDLDQLAGDLAPNTDANGQALGNLKDTLAILDRNDHRFFELVRSLDRLADDGNRILDEHLDDISNQIRGLRDVSDAISDEQASLAQLLINLYRHNETVPMSVRNNFVNVLLDVVLCGVPGGGDVPGDPVDACYPGEAK
jgi:phospholipid/cholesterol/gamma-HCH transport system substrate-binding protein